MSGWLYASCCEDGQLWIYRAEGAAVTVAQRLHVHEGPRRILFSGDGRRMYLATQAGAVKTYDMTRPDNPRWLHTTFARARMCNLGLMPGTLLGVSYNGGLVQSWALDADGIPHESRCQVWLTGKAAHCICPEEGEGAFYVPHPDIRLLERFVLDAPGAIHLAARRPMSVDIRHLKRRGGVYYGVAFRDSAVCRLEERAGFLALTGWRSTLPPGFRGENSGSELQLHPRLPVLYAANRGADDLAVFRLTEERMSPVGRIPVDAEPTTFCLDGPGETLYTAGKESQRIAADALDGAGIPSGPRRFTASGNDILWLEYREDES